MTENYKVNVSLTKGEISIYNFYHIRWLLFFDLLGLIVFVGMVYLSFSHPDSETRELLSTISIWAAILLAVGLSQPLILIMQIYLIKSPGISDLMNHRSYRLTDEGIHISANGREAVSAWPDIKTVKDTGRIFLIFTRRKLAYVIPRRCFSSREKMVHFIEFLMDRLKAPK